jgi:hypothetical protein
MAKVGSATALQAMPELSLSRSEMRRNGKLAGGAKPTPGYDCGDSGGGGAAGEHHVMGLGSSRRGDSGANGGCSCLRCGQPFALDLGGSEPVVSIRMTRSTVVRNAAFSYGFIWRVSERPEHLA